MDRKKILLIGLLFSFCLPGLGFADCTPLGRFDHWVLQEDESIIFYAGNVPLGTVEVQDCVVNSSSVIRLLSDSVCDGDEFLVDGERCTLLSVTVPES